MEKKAVNLEQTEKVTGGAEKRKYTTDPRYARPEEAINDNGPDARMEEAVVSDPVPVPISIPVPVPDPNPEKSRKIM